MTSATLNRAAVRIAASVLIAVMVVSWLAMLAGTVLIGLASGLAEIGAAVLSRPILVLAAVMMAFGWRLLVVALGGA